MKVSDHPLFLALYEGRRDRGWTREQFSEQCGVLLNTIGAYERGNRSAPIDVIAQLLAHFEQCVAVVAEDGSMVAALRPQHANADLAVALRRLREGKGWSMQHVADLTGFSLNTVTSYEKLKRRMFAPNIDGVLSLFGCRLEVLNRCDVCIDFGNDPCPSVSSVRTTHPVLCQAHMPT